MCKTYGTTLVADSNSDVSDGQMSDKGTYHKRARNCTTFAHHAKLRDVSRHEMSQHRGMDDVFILATPALPSTSTNKRSRRLIRFQGRSNCLRRLPRVKSTAKPHTSDAEDREAAASSSDPCSARCQSLPTLHRRS